MMNKVNKSKEIAAAERKIKTLQASFEMMLIASAIVGLSLTGIGIYNNFEHIQKSAYASIIANFIGNNSINNISSIGFSTNEPQIYASLHNITYVNKSNNLQLIFSLPSESNISIIIANSIKFRAFPKSKELLVDGVYTLSFSIVPISIGPYTVNISIAIANISESNNLVSTAGTTNINISVDSYAMLSTAANATWQDEYSPSTAFEITRHNESMLYNIGNNEEIYSAFMRSYCTSQWGYWWSTFKHINMCNGIAGSTNIGYFWEPYSCNYEQPELFCIYLSNTNHAYSTINNTYSIMYNISVAISGLFQRTLYSNLSSYANTEKINEPGNKTGSITVNNVSGNAYEPYLSYVLMNNSGNRYAVNISVFSLYWQSLESLRQDAQYYDGASLNTVPSELSLAIDSLNIASQQFIGASQENNSVCSIASKLNDYVCKPLSLLFYNILFNTSDPGIENMTIESQGSSLHIYK